MSEDIPVFSFASFQSSTLSYTYQRLDDFEMLINVRVKWLYFSHNQLLFLIRDMPLVAHPKSFRKRISWVEYNLLEATNPCTPLDGRKNCIIRTNLTSASNMTKEFCTCDAFMAQDLVLLQKTLCMQYGQSSTGSCPTRTPVNSAWRDNHCIDGSLAILPVFQRSGKLNGADSSQGFLDELE
jgi:hypothetical protein